MAREAQDMIVGFQQSHCKQATKDTAVEEKPHRQSWLKLGRTDVRVVNISDVLCQRSTVADQLGSYTGEVRLGCSDNTEERVLRNYFEMITDCCSMQKIRRDLNPRHVVWPPYLSLAVLT
jgi:hypothetical protein